MDINGLLSALPTADTDMARLRRQFVMRPLDQKVLRKHGFNLLGENQFIADLAKRYSAMGGSYMMDVKVRLSKRGNVLSILQTDTNFQEWYPEGWGGSDVRLELDDLFIDEVREAVKRDLEAACIGEPGDALDEFAFLLEDLTPDGVVTPYDHLGYCLCALANNINDTDWQAVAVCVTSDYIDQISLIICLTDLTHMSHRQRMPWECSQLIRRIFSIPEVTDKLKAEMWTNIGNTYCDRFGKQEAAIFCFETAMRINPSLLQPRENIKIARRRLQEQKGR